MKKIPKYPSTKQKASHEQKPKVPQKIAVSFADLTTNKDYNFDYFSGSDLKGKLKAFEQFTAFLQRLTSQTRLDISKKSKKDDCGLETIDLKFLKFKPNVSLGSDTKIDVFRFGNGKYRLIGFFEKEQDNVLKILGFDFDYSAYEH